MPKKTKATRSQPSLLKRQIPQMPEGYYSAGPNPNLRRFVEEHSHPYDPQTDDYDVPPFDQPITTTKATAIYNMHTYWSKKPHDAIRQYIRHYTKPGDLVLDPFCGSGGTALAALMEGRAAIAIDLSPAATFITKNYCTPVDTDALQAAFEELKTKVQPEMDWLYETRCDRCDGRATTAYTVYSYVFQCPRCLEKVPLFDCPEVQSHTAAGKPKKIRICPHCQARGHQEEIKTSGVRFEAVPVLVSYLCQEGCKPKRGQRRHNDSDEKKREYFERYDLGKIAEIEAKPIPYWYPPHRMMNVESDTAPWGDEWRPGRNFRRIADLYTKRSLWSLACIREGVLSCGFEKGIQDKVLFALQGILLINSKMCRAETTQTQNGTYYLPQVFKELYCLNSVESKIRVFSEALNELQTNSTDLCISTQSTTKLDQVPEASIDLIFTDPPYANKVQYGELNFIWEAWQNFDTYWHDKEIIVNETRGKTAEDWANQMHQAMSECFRVLKPGHWISLCYHDTSEGTWQLVQDIMSEVGFISENSESALYIETGQKAYNQLMAEKVTKRDLVINFRKPNPGELTTNIVINGTEDEATFTNKASSILIELLEDHPGETTDRLYDELVSRMVRRGEFERHNFDELLRSVAEPVRELVMENLFEAKTPDLFGTHETVRWYLKDISGSLDEAEGKKEAAAANRLERFMVERRKDRGEPGVHYSDLFEQYLPIADKPRRRLIEWLPEYFFKTEEGTWRPPEDDEEREQKAVLRSSGTLRRIKRFTNALLQGVPPYHKDQPENTATLADWIRQCRRAGLYEQGRVLFEKGGLRFDQLSEDAQLEVEEDYQICIRRSEKKPAAPKKKKQETLFEADE